MKPATVAPQRRLPHWLVRLNPWRTLFEILLIAAIVYLAGHPAASFAFWGEGIVHQVPTREKLVALTFDDGPYPDFTPQILNVLAKYDVKATFFMIGRAMEAYPEIVKEVVAQGHVIANHSYSHPPDLKTDSELEVLSELERCEHVIEKLTGRRAHLFRPPRGMLDGAVAILAQQEGYRTILWTVSADHHDAPTPALMAARVRKWARPGCIILAHDGRIPARWKDVAALPLIIESLRSDGYRFVTIPELLKHARKK